MRREVSFSFVDNDGEASDFYSNKPETQRAGVGGIAAFSFSQSQDKTPAKVTVSRPQN